MIVKCITKREDVYQDTDLIIGELYCVLGLTFYSDGNIDYNLLMKEEENCYHSVLFPWNNFDIIDSALPNNWSIKSYEDNPFGVKLNIHSKLFRALQGDDIYENDNIGFINAVNEILGFHNWPLLEIPDYLLPEPTAEERRRKEMEDELEEYLRIAEEDKKDK